MIGKVFYYSTLPLPILTPRISKRKSKSYSCMDKARKSPEEAKKLLLMVPEVKTRVASDSDLL